MCQCETITHTSAVIYMAIPTLYKKIVHVDNMHSGDSDRQLIRIHTAHHHFCIMHILSLIITITCSLCTVYIVNIKHTYRTPFLYIKQCDIV